MFFAKRREPIKKEPQEETLAGAILRAAHTLKTEGTKCKPKMWQANEVSMGMHEIFNFQLDCRIPDTMEELRAMIKPNLPWADIHFDERVSRIPMNPAPSYKIWPYYKQDEKWRRAEGDKFSHTYPERIWAEGIDGVRYKYGNLQDVINLLTKDPLTRQAFLPMWFPEDTGAHHGERVPCSIGWWFICRDNKLSVYYPMRSCDYRRHFRNDIYMACKLVAWMLGELQTNDTESFWDKVELGNLNMQVWNLHVFDGEENFI